MFALITIAVPLWAADPVAERDLLDAEETYELRLQRILKASGHQALVEHLTKEMATNPRPYTKAWHANYLLYGEEFGLKAHADPKRGFALAKEAAAEGSLFGLELLGRAWGDGRGSGFRDTKAATKFLQQAADRGRDTALCELAKFYFIGRPGIMPDRDKAEQLARRAAWLGATVGLYHLAEWWENPRWTNPPNPARALALYHELGLLGVADARAVIQKRAESGDALAQKYAYLGFVVDAREGAVAYPSKVRTAVKWLRENTAPDDAQVQVALAELLIEKSGPVYDPKAAREGLERVAATSDDARALLATMAWRGIGQKADSVAAIATWRELTDKGNARAQHALARLHWWDNAQRHGVAKDAKQAFELSRRSADGGYWQGQFSVAECYAHGIGTAVNYHLAAKYYDSLASRGYIRAKEMKDRMLAHVKD